MTVNMRRPSVRMEKVGLTRDTPFQSITNLPSPPRKKFRLLGQLRESLFEFPQLLL